jgi:hypothetical protein
MRGCAWRLIPTLVRLAAERVALVRSRCPAACSALVQQVERAIHDVVRVVAAVEEEPRGGFVQLGQAQLTAGRCRPG